MPPEMIDFLTNLQLDTQAFLNAERALSARFQEGLDRGYASVLPGLAYPLPGDLDYLDDGEIEAAFAAWVSVQGALDANQRLIRKSLLALVRSWTR